MRNNSLSRSCWFSASLPHHRPRRKAGARCVAGLLLPVLMGAGMSGTAVARPGSEVDTSASDIFSNLQFGAMAWSWREGELGRGGDAIWIARGANGAPRDRWRDRERRMSRARLPSTGCAASLPPPTSFRRARQLSEHRSPHRQPTECAQRRRIEDVVRPDRRPAVAHPGERQTVACAGLHGDRRLRRRVDVHVAGVSDGRGEPRPAGLNRVRLPLARSQLRVQART